MHSLGTTSALKSCKAQISLAGIPPFALTVICSLPLEAKLVRVHMSSSALETGPLLHELCIGPRACLGARIGIPGSAFRIWTSGFSRCSTVTVHLETE